MAKTRKIIERVTEPFAGSQVDREAGVIRNTLICGWESANGRDYTRESFGDGSQYRGRPVYANHSTGSRRIEDKVGWFGESITFDAQGRPRGDFHVLKSHHGVGAWSACVVRVWSPLPYGWLCGCFGSICRIPQ